MSQRHQFRDGGFTVTTTRTALGRALREAHPGASWNDVKRLLRSGKVWVDEQPACDPGMQLEPGAQVVVRMSGRPASRERALVEIVFIDSQLVVVNKPSGISTVPYDKDERDTLIERLQAVLRARHGSSRDASLHVVHRIDKETSGLLVFARTQAALRILKHQFRLHTVQRRYEAVAHGLVKAVTLDSRLVPNRGDGLRGSTDNPRLGRRAITHVRPMRELRDSTLVECRLETGRTHQIRIHLAEAGHPLVGERVYQRRYRGTLIEAPRLMLHAATLGLRHPSREEDLLFERPPPADFLAHVSALLA